MNSDFLPGRRLYRICGRAIVHSTNMDVLYFTESATESVPVFKQRGKAGRIVVELLGYLAFPESAVVTIIHLNTHFQAFSLPEVFMEDLSDVRVAIATNLTNNYSEWRASIGPGGFTLNSFNSDLPQTSTHRLFTLSMTDGTDYTLEPVLVFPTADQDFTAYYGYYSKYVLLPPVAGMTLDEVLALGWKVVYDSQSDNEPRSLWDGKPF